MPNWCVGTLKVRGEKSNLTKFILEGLKPVNGFGTELGTLKLNKYGDVNYEHTCWIKGTTRGFVRKVEAYLSELDYGGIILLEAKFAWDIDPKQLKQICEEYNIDMKIYAYERGMQFNQSIEIINGEIVKDDVIKFDDYDWECDNPDLGG